MGPEVLAYPFLFIATFFESFLLVTLLSKPARDARERGPAKNEFPSVAIIVPCWNEAATVGATCQSLLALDYPKDKLEIILVNDGSTDTTAAAMVRFEGHPQVRIVHKENGGKHTALNTGVAMIAAEYIGCLDADSFVERDALKEIVASFDDPSVGATTGAMSAHEPGNMLQHMQNIEYIFGIAFRHAIASVNGLYVTPGPFSFYRHSVLKELGGFRYGHQTEDMEMALRIQRAGYRIENAPRARVYTKTPRTVHRLIKQRTRWTTGFLRNVLGEYRGLIGNRRYGVLGVLMLPTAFIAIGSSILLFFLMLYELGKHAIDAYSLRIGIPYTYSLLPHGSLDWFYFPSNFYVVLGAFALAATLALIIIGKRISKTPAVLSYGFISYIFLYGFIVPLWLLRAATDVTFNRSRNWR